VVPADNVDVWLISTDVSDRVLAEFGALLDDDERERAGALLYPARRRQFIASHGAFRVILGRHLGMPPGSLRWLRGPHGKPALAGSWPQVSMSQSGSLAALAIAGNRRIGIDVQRLLADLDVTRMARRFYPPREARFVGSAAGPAERVERFTRLWARKEACVKVSGGRLLPGLQLTVLRTGVIAPDLPGTSADSYRVRDLRVPRGFRAAVAAEGTRPFRITRHLMYMGQRPTPSPASEIAAQ
jgi:4'-phosphopantetheinyl transferase